MPQSLRDSSAHMQWKYNWRNCQIHVMHWIIIPHIRQESEFAIGKFVKANRIRFYVVHFKKVYKYVCTVELSVKNNSRANVLCYIKPLKHFS